MLVEPHDRPPQWFQMKIPTGISLLAVALILSVAIALSIAAARRKKINHG
jgi:hypothetical protein